NYLEPIVDRIFGIEASLFGTITAKPQFGPLDPKAELRNINYQGKNYIAGKNGIRPQCSQMKKITFFAMVGLLALTINAQQATTPSLLQIGDRYWMQPDIVYGSANNTPLKLDIWYPRDNPNPTPTLVYIHGGGWIFGTKEGSVYQLLPYLERGWRVVNVEYRMAGNSLAPGAVEDTRCALRWIYRN